jgi:hypothetical protein
MFPGILMFPKLSTFTDVSVGDVLGASSNASCTSTLENCFGWEGEGGAMLGGASLTGEPLGDGVEGASILSFRGHNSLKNKSCGGFVSVVRTSKEKKEMVKWDHRVSSNINIWAVQ